jgi:hypothetical protein
MTLLFDDSKKLEKAIGEEATRAVLNIVEAAKGETVTGAELEKLRGETLEGFAQVRGDIKRLEMQIRLLIILALVAIAMFSPNLAALLKLAK